MNLIPKLKRIVDPKAILAAWTRDSGRCLVCGEPVRQSSVHHIKTRGAGGHDVVENLVTLCRPHHDEAHHGRWAMKELFKMLADRYGYCYDVEE